MKIDGGWRCVGTTAARDNADALANTIALLPTEHPDKPMKFVEVERGDGPGPAPCAHA